MRIQFKLAAICAGIFTSLNLTGCFSMVTRTGNGWSGDPPSKNAKVTAGVADAVTLPIQAPLIAAAAIARDNRQAETDRGQQLLVEIKKNPEYIFQHRLHVSSSRTDRDAVVNSFWDNSVPFTDAQLRRLYKEIKGAQNIYVLCNPHCSLKFLGEIRAEIEIRNPVTNTPAFEQILKNPNIPDQWLEEVAADRIRYGIGLSDFAKERLERRKSARTKST